MKQDLQDRLRRLGVIKGTRNLKSPSLIPGRNLKQISISSSKSEKENRIVEKLFPGRRLENTTEGPCFVVDQVYPLTYVHGPNHYQIYWSNRRRRRPILSGQADWKSGIQDLLFLDTETTGLSGAGTLAFMVGIAFFEQSGSAGSWSFANISCVIMVMKRGCYCYLTICLLKNQDWSLLTAVHLMCLC